MSRYLLDIASYQGALTLADVARAGFTAVNLKTSHALSQKTVHPKVVDYAAEAKRRKLGISTFHWLTGDHPGARQAEYAYDRLITLGLDRTAAHVVDVEEQAGDGDTEAPPRWEHVRDYVTTMQRLLARPIMLYTGDWWWQAKGRSWNGAALTPYLMAAPNDGYPGSYPGDTSPKWNAGYGGWKTLACMQYAVQPLTFDDGTKGKIDVSKALIRDPKVWQALTTPAPHPVPPIPTEAPLVTSQSEFNDLMTGYLTTPAGRSAVSAIVSGALSGLPEAVAAELTDGTADEAAAKLKAILGDRADEVGRILSGGTS